MIKSVIVLGGGSAGFLVAMALKKRLPDLSVTVIRSSGLGVIGVGESTTVALPKFLHGYLGIDPSDFMRRAKPSFKLGVRFLWGPRPRFDYTFGLQMDWKWDRLSKNNGFYCDDDLEDVDIASALMAQKKAFVRKPNGDPYVGNDFGYHIDNPRFVAFLEEDAAKMGVALVDDVIEEVQQDDRGVTAVRLASKTIVHADLWIDSTGFRALVSDKTLSEPFVSFGSTLFTDRAVVGSWARADDEEINPYTTAETMEAGWCWQIDHPDSVNRGYVYSSSFLGDDEAEKELRAKNPKIGDTRVIKFTSGRRERGWVKNVVAVGNAAGFVEPLESTALWIIVDEARMLAELLYESGCDPTPSLVDAYNRVNARAWDNIRNFLAIHFKFNTRLDSAFWRACREKVELGPVEALVDYYRANGPSTFARTTLVHGNDLFGMEGYLTLLVGQKVPHERRHVPTPEERAFWNEVRVAHRVKAFAGLGVRDALEVLTSPSWRWVPGAFGGRRAAEQPLSTQITSYIGVSF